MVALGAVRLALEQHAIRLALVSLEHFAAVEEPGLGRA